ncbi:MAG: Nudix family hydrolase [Thiomicrorhabdus sp.]|jgi:8-oxo-dGTP diphosphatase|nr:Nudix family hydrolase [Thiomicrorhabdus sp.]
MAYTEIAIGVLKRGNTVCLSLRQSSQSFAGLWEFPGGKVEAGESIENALKREFLEELAVETSDWKPLITIPWRYPTVAVRLNVYITETFEGEPHGNEGQKVAWTSITELANMSFPEANKGIIMALLLADKLMISGGFENQEDALQRLQIALDNGIRLCQLRAKNLTEDEFVSLAAKAIKLGHDYQAKILLNGRPELLELLPDADGVQLASNVIFDYQTRPIAKNKLLGISTHTSEEVEQALKLESDFILLSPVKETSSHPGVPGIGWQKFADAVKAVPIPVFALGGMKPEDLEQAKKSGAQGVAAISGFWPN